MAAVLKIDRKLFEETMRHRFFYGPSFNIYDGKGSVAGLYDYGPMGCALKTNLIQLWRSHFVLEENMLEVDCPQMTPAPILKASGHVEKFTDLMVQDVKTNEYFRADHLLEGKIDQMMKVKKITPDKLNELQKAHGLVDAWSQDPTLLEEKLTEYEVKSPETGNDISKPVPFNLMFKTSIGPTGYCDGFLRPETAQGIFVNFRRLLGFNQSKMPFAAAQVGTSFRNEISPKQGLLRLREFQMAEIEHFLNPKDKSHPKFKNVAHLELQFLSGCRQVAGEGVETKTLGEAVESKLVNNETLGYYLGRIYLFLLRAGIKKDYVRFRQHMDTEMAHYAADCWDAELLLSSGWTECVGCADRSAYDLQKHSEFSGTPLVAQERLPEPIKRTVQYISCNKKVMGPKYGKKVKDILQKFDSMTSDEVNAVQKDMDAQQKFEFSLNGETITILPEMVTFKVKDETIIETPYTPNVIEPSFGIGRIVHAILEQNFYLREGSEQRTVLSIPAIIAPVAVSILPLQNSPELIPFIEKLRSEFRQVDVAVKVDDSGVKIGRRYARTDEIGCAFGTTIDFDTVKDNTVTLRERDSCSQIRIPISEVADSVRALTRERLTWADLVKKYGEFKFEG